MRTGLRLLALAAGLSTLTTCGFLFDSPFPEYLTRVEELVDVGDWLPYTPLR